MSRPKNYWYGIASKMAKRYPEMNENKSFQEQLFKMAIDQTMQEIRSMRDGDERISAIEAVCIYQTDSVCSIAKKMHYGERTIQRWISAFINEIGNKAGF